MDVTKDFRLIPGTLFQVSKDSNKTSWREEIIGEIVVPPPPKDASPIDKVHYFKNCEILIALKPYVEFQYPDRIKHTYFFLVGDKTYAIDSSLFRKSLQSGYLKILV